MKFKEFKEKYFGKSIEEIKDGLNKEENFFKKDIDVVQLCIDSGSCADIIMNLDMEFVPLYLFKKKYLIMLYILENLTNLEMIPEDERFDDYDAFVEKAILESNSNAYLFKNMVEEIIKEKQNNVLKELYNTFSNGLPTTQDIQNMKEQLDNMFRDESPEKLQTIENILAYNDPNLKQIKDFMFDSRFATKEDEGAIQEEKSNSTEQKEALEIVKNAKISSDKIVDLINETPMVKEVNDKIKEEQKQRVLEYNKQLEEMLQKEE